MIKFYIFVIINIITIEIVYKTLLTKVLLSCFFLLFIVYYYYKKKKKITIEDLSIKDLSDLIPFLFLFIICYILGLFYMRFCNFGKILDLKDFYNKAIIFFTEQKYTVIFITLFFYILIIIIFLIFLNKIKKNIKLNLFKIHIYLRSCFPLDFFHKNIYSIFIIKYYQFFMKISSIFNTLYNFLKKYITIYILKENYDHYKTDKFQLFLTKIGKKNPFIILIILIIYDIIVNNFILIKMFYFLPIVFLYNLILLAFNILTLFDPDEENIIVSQLYFNVEYFNFETSEILYTNNIEATLQNLKDIEIKLNEEF